MIINVLSATPMSRYGIYVRSPLSHKEAQELLKGNEVRSFVGHEATATALERILGVSNLYNRAMWSPVDGDICIALSAKQRLPEGAVITDVQKIIELFDISKVVYVDVKHLEDLIFQASVDGSEDDPDDFDRIWAAQCVRFGISSDQAYQNCLDREAGR